MRGERCGVEGAAIDREDVFPRDLWPKLGDLGLLGITVPERHGGAGLGYLAHTVAMTEISRASGAVGLSYVAHSNLCVNQLRLNGTAAQLERHLPKLVAGEHVGALAMSEPEAGSDIFAMQTRAERRGDEWVLNGRKTWITAGTISDLYLCFATTDPSRGILGISTFLIPRDAPGFRVVREIPKMGMKSVPMGELAFEDCRLPAEAHLGREGRGATIFNAAMELERGAILSASLGTMRRQLERCIDRARTRKQSGRPIGQFQSVSNRLAEMAVRLEASRLMIYRFADLHARGQEASTAASMAKLFVSESFHQNSVDAVRLFGAAGYAEETGLERELRDSVGGLIYSGTNDIQRNIIAHGMRLG